MALYTGQPSCSKTGFRALIYYLVRFRHDIDCDYYGVDLFFSAAENTLTGLESAAREKRDLFRMLGATRLQTLLRLKIPSGLPMIMTGVRIAGVLALVGAVVGEFIGGNSGLGASIIAAQGMMDSALMFALFIVITVLGLLVYFLTAGLEYFVLRGFKRNTKTHV